MESDVKAAQRRAYRYWYEDGFIDLLLGAFLLLVGLTTALAWVDLPEGLQSILGPMRILVVIAAALMLRQFLSKLKHQVTYPRTGYVAYRQRGPALRWLKTASGLLLGGMISVLAATGSPLVRWTPILLGALLGAIYLFLGMRLRLPRYHILTFVSIVCGGIVSWVVEGHEARLVALVCGVGLAQLVTGAVTLLRYLHANPRSEAVP